MKIRCLKCKDIIESLSVHDYRKCKCGACSIDGGKEYTRIGGDFKFINIVNENGTEQELGKEINLVDTLEIRQNSNK